MRTHDARWRIRALASAVAVLLGACSSKRLYDGPDRSASEVAHVRTSVVTKDGTYVTIVDGKRTIWLGATKFYEVLPGPHTADIYLTWRNGNVTYTSPTQRVSFQARAGVLYECTGTVQSLEVKPDGNLYMSWTPVVLDVGPIPAEAG